AVNAGAPGVKVVGGERPRSAAGLGDAQGAAAGGIGQHAVNFVDTGVRAGEGQVAREDAEAQRVGPRGRGRVAQRNHVGDSADRGDGGGGRDVGAGDGHADGQVQHAGKRDAIGGGAVGGDARGGVGGDIGAGVVEYQRATAGSVDRPAKGRDREEPVDGRAASCVLERAASENQVGGGAAG